MYSATKSFSDIYFLFSANESYSLFKISWYVHIDKHMLHLTPLKIDNLKMTYIFLSWKEILSLSLYISKSFYRIWLVGVSEFMFLDKYLESKKF